MIALFIYLLLIQSVSGRKPKTTTQTTTSSSSGPIKTNHGNITGQKNKKFPTVTEYLGVPFAEPPVDSLRFMPPKPLNDSAYGVNFKADKPARTCFHKRTKANFRGFDEWDPEDLEMSEDCLQLNMWVPDNKSSNAILVFIYGRAYHKGAASIEFFNGSAFAANTNVTFITINYRLGALGFGFWKGNNGSIIVPGNMGLLDQQMALQWIKNNSKHFGYDNPSITLMGHGSGSAAATAHLYSKGSRHLFHRLVAASGTIENRWAVEKNKHVRDNFKTLIGIVGCNVSKINIMRPLPNVEEKNDTKVLECMQKINVSVITNAYIKNLNQSMIVGPFLPVENDTLFFNGSIKHMLGTGTVYKNTSLLIGLESYDAAYFMPQFLKGDKYGCGLNYSLPMEDPVNQCHMNETRLKNAIKLVAQEYNITDELFRDGLRQIYDFSFTTQETRYRDRAVKLFTDIVMQCEILEFARKISNITTRKNYMFVFNKRSTYNPWPKWMGATHGYELLYFFGHPFLNENKYKESYRKQEKDFSLKAMKILAKFAKEEYLQREWSEFEPENLSAAVIKADTFLRNLSDDRNMNSLTCKNLKELLSNYTKVPEKKFKKQLIRAL